jgi:hypothetical protein
MSEHLELLAWYSLALFIGGVCASIYIAVSERRRK